MPGGETLILPGLVPLVSQGCVWPGFCTGSIISPVFRAVLTHIQMGFERELKVPYLWIVEPQKKSGYPHIHAGYFTEFTDEKKDRLKGHWSHIVKAGDYRNGFNFSIEQSHKTGDISSLRNYLDEIPGKGLYRNHPGLVTGRTGL